jgi:hypothetical protein
MRRITRESENCDDDDNNNNKCALGLHHVHQLNQFAIENEQ